MTIFLIILTIIAAIGLVASCFIMDKTTHISENKSKVIAGFVAAFIVIVISMGAYTVQSGTVGVISTMGKYDAEEKLAGFHLKIPFVQTVYNVDVKQLVSQEQVNMLDSNNLPLTMHVSLKWRIIDGSADKMLTKYGYDIFDKLIKPTIRKTVRDVVGGYNGEDIAKDRVKLAVELEAKLTEIFAAYPEQLFEFAGLDVRDIKLDDSVMNKIKAVQNAKQREKELKNEVLQKDQEAKKRKIDADTAYYEKKRAAEANAISIVTKANANAEAAEANAIAIVTEAKAQAEANKLVARSLSKQLIENNKISKWDGGLPKVTGSNDMNLFIPNEYAK